METEDKESTGYSRSPIMTLNRTSHKSVRISKDKKKEAQTQVSCTGKLWWCCDEKDHCPQYKVFSVNESTESSLEVTPQTSMYGRKTPELKAPSSSSEDSPCVETTQPIGMTSGTTHKEDYLKKFRQTCVYNITGHYEPLERITRSLKLWYDNALCSVDPLVLVSPDEPGKKLVYLLILRIHELNSGTATEIKNMLLSMNFEALSTYPTCSDGLIGTLVLWRSRDLPRAW